MCKVSKTPRCASCKTACSQKTAFCRQHLQCPGGDGGIRLKRAACMGAAPQDLLRATPSIGKVDWPLLPHIASARHQQSVESLKNSKRTGDVDAVQAADFVTCRTVRMKKRVNRRSGGWLVTCSEQGLVMDAVELFGGESLTQRAAAVARAIDRFPAVETVVHDDGCHLRRFMDRWFPQLHFIIDKFHSAAHVDRWRRERCMPNLLQSGSSSSKVTRAACAYGGAGAQTVSFALVGNAHPTTALDMLQALLDARLQLLTTASCSSPPRVKVSGPRFVWTDIPPELAQLAGLEEVVADLDRAASGCRAFP